MPQRTSQSPNKTLKPNKNILKVSKKEDGRKRRQGDCRLTGRKEILPSKAPLPSVRARVNSENKTHKSGRSDGGLVEAASVSGNALISPAGVKRHRSMQRQTQALCFCFALLCVFREAATTYIRRDRGGRRERGRKESRKKGTNVRHVSCAGSKRKTSSRSNFSDYYLLSLVKDSVASTGDCGLLEQLSRGPYTALCCNAVLGLPLCLDFVVSRHGSASGQITIRTDFPHFSSVYRKLHCGCGTLKNSGGLGLN